MTRAKPAMVAVVVSLVAVVGWVSDPAVDAGPVDHQLGVMAELVYQP